MNNSIFIYCIMVLFCYTSNAMSMEFSHNERPIRIVFGWPEGSGSHFVFRKLHNNIKAPLNIIVENRPGVGGGISQQYVSEKTPDGRTLLWTTSSIVSIAMYNKTFTFDPIRSFDTIFYVGQYDQVLLINSSLPENLNDLIDYTKRNPKKLMYGYNGEGSSTYRAPLQIFNGNVVGIPYKLTAQMIPDIVESRIHMTLVSAVYAKTFVDNKRVRLIASTGKKRIDWLNIPTVSEFIPNYEQTIWHGILAPKGVPKDVKNFLYKYFNSGITDSFIKDMKEYGMEITEKDFDKVLLDEVRSYK